MTTWTEVPSITAARDRDIERTLDMMGETQFTRPPSTITNVFNAPAPGDFEILTMGSDAFDAYLDEEYGKVVRERPEELRFDTELSYFAIDFHNYMATGNQAIVELDVQLDDEKWRVTGESRRDGTDKADKNVGLMIATSRALSTVSRHFEKQALGRIKHAQDVKLAAEKRKAKIEYYVDKTKDMKMAKAPVKKAAPAKKAPVKKAPAKKVAPKVKPAQKAAKVDMTNARAARVKATPLVGSSRKKA